MRPIVKMCFQALGALLVAGLFVVPGLHAQTPDDTNEGSKVEWDGTNEIWRLKWWGKSGHTYFIQHSEDLTGPWQWVPVIESGDDSIREWGFTTTGDRFFLRLRHTDIATSDPENDDFDGDGLSNMQELLFGADPLNMDTNDDGMIDGISVALGISPLQQGYVLADSDNDGLDNLSEILLGLNPNNPDTNGNGIPDAEEYVGFPGESPYAGASASPDASDEMLPQRAPVIPSDSDNDGWSDADDTSPNDPDSGAPPSIGIDFYGSSNGQFEAWRPVLQKTVTDRTCIYRISGQVNYQNTSTGHYKDYAYVLDQGPLRENALHWSSPVTFIDLDSGSPASDHVYYVAQTGNGSPQRTRPQDVKSQDIWSPGGGEANGVADSYEDNTGVLTVQMLRPKVRVVEYVPYDEKWRPDDPSAMPEWEEFPSNGRLFTGDDAMFQVDLGASRLNDKVASVTCSIATQDGPQGGTIAGIAVSGEPRRAQFVNLSLAGRVHVVANVQFEGGQSIMVDDYIEIAVRTKSVSVIQWLDPASIQPKIPLLTCVIWAMAKSGALPPPLQVGLSYYLNDDACRLAASEWILRLAPDAIPKEGQNFTDPQDILAFFNEEGSRYRLGNTFRKRFSPYQTGGSWTMRGTGLASQPVRVFAGHTQLPLVPAETLAKVVRDWTLACLVMGTEEHPVNFGALRTNTSNGNERTRLNAAARVGKLGQLINSLIWPNDVPWIFSNITFDAAAVDGQPVEDPQVSAFPTTYIYIDGRTSPDLQIQQSSVEEFLQTWNIPPPSIDP